MADRFQRLTSAGHPTVHHEVWTFILSGWILTSGNPSPQNELIIMFYFVVKQRTNCASRKQRENDLYGSWHPGFPWEVKASVGIPYQKRKPSCWWLFCMEGAPKLEKGNMPWPKDHERPPLLRSLVIEQTIRGWLSPHSQGTLHLDFLLCLKHTMLSTLDLWCLCRDKTHPHN